MNRNEYNISIRLCENYIIKPISFTYNLKYSCKANSCSMTLSARVFMLRKKKTKVAPSVLKFRCEFNVQVYSYQQNTKMKKNIKIILESSISVFSINIFIHFQCV